MTPIRALRLASLVLVAAPLAAQAGDAGTVYTQLGINGLGLGYAASVSPDWAVRGQFNWLPKQSYTGNVGDFGSGANLTIDLNWSSVQLVGDWYPSSGGFRLSGGLVFNDNKITVVGTGNVNGTPGTVNGEIKMSQDVAPYVGLGYSIRPRAAKGLGFNIDAGVMFQNPKASLSATGGPSAADIEAQRIKMQEAIDQLKIMPVLAVGVSYSF
jgi:hypothetical protein